MHADQQQHKRARADAASVQWSWQEQPRDSIWSLFGLPCAMCERHYFCRGRRSRDNRFVVKAIWRVTKAASSNSDREKDQWRHTHLQTAVCFGRCFFFKWKPQVVVSLVLWSNWAAAKLRPVDGAKHNSSLFVFLIPPCSETIWSLPIIPSRRSLWVGRRMRDRFAVICSILRLLWLISAAQTRRGCHGADRRKSRDPN